MSAERSTDKAESSSWRWGIDVGSTQTEKYRVREIKFGDGYQQRVPDGINHVENTWDIRSSLFRQTELPEVVSFLRNYAGVEPIDFVDPVTGEVFKALIGEWRIEHVAKTMVRISMTVVRTYSFP